MSDSKTADLILHPIRMRIIQSLVTGRKLSRQQLSELLPDIPQATMYRHLNILEKAGVIVVDHTVKQRGATEKVYTMDQSGASISEEELRQMSSEEHMGLFLQFLSLLSAEYSRYLEQPQFDLFKDGVSFRQVELYLSDEEFKETLLEIRTALQKRAANGPASNRRKRTFSTIVIPEPIIGGEKSDES
ncbi:helix-turn-helix domain-containing protein [Paenibacillus sediminis]|uniref:ArsR family transcriptional regulator n=1 Tax=Paenibacillus sediminis TaxID=664909 RepID=A0ABS4H498_9BACL|nr:helix-turn-helix domain-containing protein [Paenibacillus sediminis]MBP1937343.1 putative ArsR family transcriptional regulator [Paenibacillus sediminis]